MGINPNLLDEFQIERTSLKDQTTQILRTLIVGGKILPGARITERDIAEMLNISRMPARDALMDLERQGLVVSKPGGRFVIQLNKSDIRHLYQLRHALEKLAVELAIANASPANQMALEAKLDEMRRAIQLGDIPAYTSSDLEMHSLVWEQAGNPYLLDMLQSMIGPIFMMIASQARLAEDWQESLSLHEQLVATIVERDTAAAVGSLEAHLQHSLDLALGAFH